MTSNKLRQAFLDFFITKKHKIVSSAPMVIKNDPTLMFTNAGMNQFKDVFLGQSAIKEKRIADSQKCLRVSGKHNDLEEVGHDTYHHTMFEMLGNWSFGDYFKKEAIDWAWEFLVDTLNISKDRLYATVFEGDKSDKLEADDEAKNLWLNYLDKENVLYGSKKDNFWEMGETGPCGPCSEVHIDIRDEAEREKIDGKELVNKDHPLVIEIWNLVFIQFNRKANGSLENLPHKHVDTGMGFERLAMVTQNKKSNYDTDIFQPIIKEIANISGFKYGENTDKDIAMRVIADHLRTIAFSIADAQLPSNNKAGYVIRRILRRAVRYAYTFLNIEEPLIYRLVDVLIKVMGNAYPELSKQKQLIERVIKEEEISFLKTLATGINLLDKIIKKTKDDGYKIVSGVKTFELYDTYGFPLDLTELILKEHELVVNKKEFDDEMTAQKSRSKQDANVKTDDWVIVKEDDIEEFVGYDFTESEVNITKYRKIKIKNKELYHLVFSLTPFYAEGGGQVGDKGYIENNDERIYITDTQKEHNQIIHISEKLPKNINSDFKAIVNNDKRIHTEANHSATHLLHYVLRNILGNHVEQKGSLVDENHLRFDFAHFQKLTREEILEIEFKVNKLIRDNIKLDEKRNLPIKQAKELGALSLFGEKYGDTVRIIKFNDSIEFCGGTHVKASGEIGYFVIKSESAIAAGIRRIEAITSLKAEKHIKTELNTLSEIKDLFKNQKNVTKSVEDLISENSKLKKEIEKFNKQKAMNIKSGLINNIIKHDGINIIAEEIDLDSPKSVKDIAFQLKGEIDNLFLVLGIKVGEKANISVMISDNLIKEKELHAGNIIKEIAKEIQGGGGGQAFFATAGGKNPNGIKNAIKKAKQIIGLL